VSSTVAVRRGLPGLTTPARVAAREQALVVGGQLLAGVGNLAYAVVMARVLAPGAFAQLAAFLALFLLIYLPARSLSAGSALSPEVAVQGRRRALGWGLVGSAAIAAVVLPLAGPLALSPALAVALATTPPLAALLALERGRLYGERAHGWLTASLIAEPLIRLGAGIALALALGAPGAALGVVVGSVGALGVARLGGAREPPRAASLARAAADVSRSRLAVLSFLFLALLQAQDVIFANATLEHGGAARFAILSTLGGVAAFATTTIPLVMLPRAREGDRTALPTALAAAVLLGLVSVAVVVLAPRLVLGLAFGERYVSLAPLAAPYMAAMALLGVARVLAANAAALGVRPASVLCGLAAALQLALLFAIGDSTEGVVDATLVVTAALTLALAGLATIGRARVVHADSAMVLEPPPVVESVPAESTTVAEPPEPEPEPDSRGRRWRTGLLLVGLMAVGVALRTFADRSLWLDEATSWYQAKLPFEVMIEDLRTSDVHPPLFHSLLALSVRLFGDSEVALRLPSLIAGTALIPMLFVTGRALYDRRTGLIAAVLGTIAPVIVWYSQEARMYALLMLFGVIAVWALHGAAVRGRARFWPLYAVACAAMIWSQYFAVLLVCVLQLALIVVLWRRHGEGEPIRGVVAGALLATLGIVALVAPLVPFAYDQFAANEAAGRGFNQPSQAGGAVDDNISLYASLANGIWAIWGYHSDSTMARLAALWPLLMLFALLLLGRGRSASTLLLVAAVVVPAGLLTAIAVAKPFLFELRYNLTAVPLLVLLIARMVSTWPASAIGRWSLGGLAAATMFVGMADQQLNGANPRIYDFEGALARVSERSEPGDVLLYQPATLNNVISYYAPGVDRRPLEGGLPSPRSEKGVFVLESFSDNPVNVEIVHDAVQRLRRQRTQVGHFELPQVEGWEFR
jgi:hypothetical protein